MYIDIQNDKRNIHDKYTILKTYNLKNITIICNNNYIELIIPNNYICKYEIYIDNIVKLIAISNAYLNDLFHCKNFIIKDILFYTDDDNYKMILSSNNLHFSKQTIYNNEYLELQIIVITESGYPLSNKFVYNLSNTYCNITKVKLLNFNSFDKFTNNFECFLKIKQFKTNFSCGNINNIFTKIIYNSCNNEFIMINPKLELNNIIHNLSSLDIKIINVDNQLFDINQFSLVIKLYEKNEKNYS